MNTKLFPPGRAAHFTHNWYQQKSCLLEVSSNVNNLKTPSVQLLFQS
jgi:hypothetical protein